MKQCRDCGVKQGLEKFHINRSKKDGRQGWCKSCHNKRARLWRRNNPGYYQKRLLRNPTYFRSSKLRLLYGLTIEDYKNMFDVQRGLCAICGKVECRKRRDGKLSPLSVDHNHGDGSVRGLLCHRCNVALAVLENSAWVKKARRYLQRFA